MLSFVFSYPGETSGVLRKIGFKHYINYGVTKALMKDWITGFMEFVAIYTKEPEIVNAWKVMWCYIEKEFFSTVENPYESYSEDFECKDSAQSNKCYFQIIDSDDECLVDDKLVVSCDDR
eukprot:UN02202